MPELRVPLTISADEYEHYYRGVAKVVIATSSDGRRVQFPANVLRPFLTRSGIHGEFVLVFDDRFKFIAIHRVDGSE